MGISVIIPTFGRLDSLESLLESLQNQTVRDDLEILVIDQNDPGYFESNLSNMAKEDVNFIQGERPNVSLARNVGAKMAKNEWLLFMDDDLEPKPNFCSSLVKGLDHSQVDCLAPLVFDRRGKELALSELMNRKDRKIVDDRFIEVNDVISASFLIHKDCYDRVGGFDEVLFDYVRCTEDKDFFTRMNALGIRVMLDTKSQLFHKEEVEGGCELRKDEYWEQRLKFMKGWIYMVFKRNGGSHLMASDWWSLSRSSFLNKKTLSSGLGFFLMALSTFRSAHYETKMFWENRF